MTDAQIESLVRRLEIEASRDSDGYRNRVVALACLGNAYLATILLLLIALMVALVLAVESLKAVAVKLLLLLGAFIWVVGRAMYVRVMPPEGIEVDEQEAPALFETIAALQRELDAPPFHHVLISADFNAAVVQVPQLGALGWPRNYLVIGLQLMKMLDVAQLRAVLAHEFGHLSRGHGRVGNWVYRQRKRWQQLMGALEQNSSPGQFLFRKFLGWYWPYFNAYSFPLARANEFEADATSARLTSAKIAAEALTNVHVLGRHLEQRYWPRVYRQANDRRAPDLTPFAMLAIDAEPVLRESDSRLWVEESMHCKTGLSDTHPSLTDRLRAIGEVPRLAPPAVGDASDVLLGTLAVGIAETFDERWRAQVAEPWRARHREAQKARSDLAALDERLADQGELSVEDSLRRALLSEEVGGGRDEALAQLRSLHARAPDDAAVSLALGCRLLEAGDDSGCDLVQLAAQRDGRMAVTCYSSLRDHCWREGRSAEAAEWHARLEERARIERDAQEERNRVTVHDSFEAHGLPPDQIEQLRTQLSAVDGLGDVWMVRKKVRHFPERPCFVFVATLDERKFFNVDEHVAATMRRLSSEIDFPHGTLIVYGVGANLMLAERIRLVPGAAIGP